MSDDTPKSTPIVVNGFYVTIGVVVTILINVCSSSFYAGEQRTKLESVTEDMKDVKVDMKRLAETSLRLDFLADSVKALSESIKTTHDRMNLMDARINPRSTYTSKP